MLDARTPAQEAMVSPLLQTKLRAPKLRPNLLPRMKLIEKLEEGREGLLTLVTAPAGFGKTTLVSQWLQCASLKYAWLSLDEADNEPVRFWLYLVSGIRSGWPDFAIRALGLLQTSPDPPLDVVLADIINGLSDEPLVLVLDDYHLISNPEIHSRLTFLLDHAPPELCLVVMSRNDPPLPLARLRAKNQLCEITAADLRASQKESRDFLRQVMKLELSDEDVQALEQRTEGWLAGLQLAALSLRGQVDASSVIDSFTGNNRYVLDYLTAEVLQRQEEDMQSFLLETSILTRLSASLCDAVTLRSNSQAMLERLEGEHLFISSLDNERCWYRYHALFADLLHHRLKLLHEGKVQDLHRRAGAWLEQRGHIAEAILHYRAAKETGLAAKLIGRTLHQAPTARNASILLGWSDALPAEIAQAFPKLVLGKAWVSLLAERPDIIETLLASPDAMGSHEPDLQNSISSLKRQLEKEASSNAMDLHDPWLQGTLLLSLATGHYHRGDWATAAKAYALAYGLLERAGKPYGMLGALLSLGSIDRLQGRLTDASHKYQKMLALATAPNGNVEPIAGHALIGLGKVMCERYELEAARESVLQGIELGAGEEPSVRINGQQTLALVYRCMGNVTGALEAFGKVETIAEANGLSPLVIRLDSYRAQLSLSQGDIEAATQWAARSGLSPHDEISYVTHPDYLTLAQVLMASGSTREALQLFERLERLAEQQARTSHLLDVLVLKSLALAQLEQESEGLTVLERVLTLTQAERQVRPLVMYGPPVQRLLECLPDDSAAYPYAQQVLAMFHGTANELAAVHAPVQPTFTPDGLPIEPLSKRELTVLRLLVGGMSNKEIAKEIYVSVNTVKTHVRNVYSKLNVTSRAQLVARVGELGLFLKA